MSSERRMDASTVDGKAARVYEAQAPVMVGTEDLTISRGELLAGAQASVVAGTVMGLVAIAVSLSYGYGFWVPFNDVAGAIAPALAAGAAFNPVSALLGVIIHFTISILLGVIFALLYAGLLKLTFKLGVPLVVGVVFGMMTWFVARYAVLPLLNSTVYGVPAFITAHAVFGATLGMLYPLMPARQPNR